MLLWKSNKYYVIWVCVCSLSQPPSTAHAPYYSVVCVLARPHSPTSSRKRHDFRKKKYTENKMRILIFSTAFVWNILHFKKKRARCYHYITSVIIQNTCYSCQILIKLNFLDRFWKIFKYQISWQYVQWKPTYSMRNDTSKLRVSLRNSTKASKN
jgi:hypothetical protein